MQLSSQKKGKSRVADESSSQTLGSSQMAHAPSALLSQAVGILHPAVGQRTLRVPPDPLVGIEFRSVGGQGNDVQAAAISPPHPLDLFSARGCPRLPLFA